MKTIWRYLRLYAYFLRFSFSKAAEFRIDFWFRTLMDTCYYIMGITFFKVLFLHTPNIGGWGEEQSMVFIASFFVVDALMMSTIASSLWFLPIRINRGEVDYYLVRPVSAFFCICLQDFAVGSFANLLMAIGFLCWVLAKCSASFSLLVLATYIFLLFLGLIIYVSLRLLVSLPVFWTQSGRGFEQIFFSAITLAERPDSIFKGAARKLLTTILPILLIASFPTRFLFSAGDFQVALHMIIVTALLLAIVSYIWKKGLRAYSSASS